MSISKRLNILIFFLLAGYFSLFAQELNYKIGDKSDGARIRRVHRIKLFDAEGNHIFPEDSPAMPFSAKMTCASECHDYSRIKTGFHFRLSGADSVISGFSEPWIYTDPTTLTMIPLSFRETARTFTPDQMGIDKISFLTRFGPYYAGGDIGEEDSLHNRENFFRWEVSGKLEINCLLCHDANPRYDPVTYGENVRRQNYRWAPAAASPLTEFEGSASAMPDNYDPYNYDILGKIDTRSVKPPAIAYNASMFDSQNRVYFDVVKEAPDERCYYCHSTVIAEGSNQNYHEDEDVHLKAGLRCVDCHQNDIDHKMFTGKSDELSCGGCHLDGNPDSGRLGATLAKHEGLPPLHLEKIHCTACHSGYRNNFGKSVKTSKNHFLCLHGTNKKSDVYPHIRQLIYGNSSGVIKSGYQFWPSYWAVEDENNLIVLLSEKFLGDTLRPLLGLDSLKNFGSWPAVSDSALIALLDTISVLKSSRNKPVFVTGGRKYFLKDGKLISQTLDENKGFIWDIAHPVRPARQSLGAGGCEDCHSPGAEFFNASIPVETSLLSARGNSLPQGAFLNLNIFYQQALAFTFFLRPAVKIILAVAVFILFVFLSGYLFIGLKSVADRGVKK